MTDAKFHQLVPEEPGVVPTVCVDAVWDDLVAAIEASRAKDRLFTMYAEREVASGGKYSDRLRVQETAVSILNICLRNGLFTPRIDSGTGFYKVPARAFVPPFESADGLPNADATTWSRGVLNRIDTTEPFEWIAAGGYALLLTEGEAGLIRERAREIIGQEEREQKRDDRDRVLDRARRGKIGIQEAEAEAQRLGLEELATRPAPEAFDPGIRTTWTLPMALAWIAWRSFDEVREWDPEHRHECSDWTTSDSHPKGRRLKRRDPATIFEFEAFGYLMWSEREDGRTDRELDRDLPKRMKSELWRALEEGAVTAHGIPPNGGPRQAIPPMEWVDLENYLDRTGKEHIRYRHQRGGMPAYSQVAVPRTQVLARWREQVSNGPKQISHTVAAEARAKAQLTEMARAHLESGAPTPVHAVWRESCGLPARAEARVWRGVAKEFPFLSERAGKPKRKRVG